MSIHHYKYLILAVVGLLCLPAATYAQLTATIQNTATGQSNGSISLNFPEGYPSEQLENIVWYPLDEAQNYLPDGSGGYATQLDDDPSTPTAIGSLAAGWYRVSFSRIGWCNAATKDFEVEECTFNFTAENHVLIGTLHCYNPVGSLFQSYSIKDNDTNEWVIENCTFVGNNNFYTVGILPHNYTLKITGTNGCTGSIEGTWAEPDGCVFQLPSDNSDAHVQIDDVVCNQLSNGNYQLSVTFSDDLEGTNSAGIFINYMSNYLNIGTSNCCATYTVDIPAAAINYELSFTVTIGGINSCTYYGTVTCADNLPVSIPPTPSTCCGTTFQATNIKPQLLNCHNETTHWGSVDIVAANNCNYFEIVEIDGPLNNVNYLDNVINNHISNLNVGDYTATIAFCDTSPSTTVAFHIGLENVIDQWMIAAQISPAFYPCTYPDEGSIIFEAAYATDIYNEIYQADTWAWSDGFTSPQPFRNGLLAQTYTVTISNSQTGCSAVRTYNMAQASNYGYHADVNPVLVACNGTQLQTGSVTIVSDSPCAMNYRLIYNGNTTNSHTLSGLSTGSHSVTIQTAFYDSVDDTTPTYQSQTLSFMVGTAPGGTWNIVSQIIPSTQNCAGEDMQTGSISLAGTQYIAPDGTISEPIDFSWHACQGLVGVAETHCRKSNTSTGLAANPFGYEVVISNSAGCTTYIEYYIGIEPAPDYGFIDNSHISVSVAHSTSVCGEDICGGAAQVSILGAGSGNYTYEWSNGCASSTAQPIDGSINCYANVLQSLCAGIYSLTVTDTETGCTAVANFNIGLLLTVQGNTVLTYTALLDEPEIRLSPTLFDNTTRVNYDLPEDGFVTIKVYNLQGVLIETLVDEEYREAGSYELNNEAGEFNNGLYLFSLEVCDRNKTQIGIKY